MILTIGDVLDQAGLEKAQQMLAEVRWKDGVATAGPVASQVKRNEQANLAGDKGGKLHDFLFNAVKQNKVVQIASRPHKWSRVIVSRTMKSGGYGRHMDNAIMGGGLNWMRTDLSFTLFLSDPETYEGGELVIDLAGSTQSFKLKAGDLLLYPSTTLHQVSDVLSGERLVCVGWIESRVREASQRELLFDLQNLRTELSKTLSAQSAELLTLDKSISNLLRMWANT